MSVQINGINHFAISVPDLEETIRWYSDIFGFTVIDRSEIPGAGIRVSHMQGAGFILEIFEAPGAAPLPEDRRIPNRDLMTHGNKHMSFGVPDGPRAKKELEDLGVEIAMVADTGHAVGMKLANGAELLIHIGRDTIALEGKGFTPLVHQGQRVRAGELLVKFDRDLIEEKGYATDCIMLIANRDAFPDLRFMSGMEAVQNETVIGEFA